MAPAASLRVALFVTALCAAAWYFMPAGPAIVRSPPAALPDASGGAAAHRRDIPLDDTEVTVRGRTPNAVPDVDVPAASGPSEAVLEAVRAQRLLVPVRGVSAADLADTYTQARSERRTHEAIDIMAPAGTPVLAVADGHVEKLFRSDRGGITLYQFDPTSRFVYYYAHLQAYAPGVSEQMRVQRGQVIGYVGSTGNADRSAPHLHFAIFVLGESRRWWEGAPVNPYPAFAGVAGSD